MDSEAKTKVRFNSAGIKEKFCQPFDLMAFWEN